MVGVVCAAALFGGACAARGPAGPVVAADTPADPRPQPSQAPANDEVAAHEATALAQGDGFDEQRPEPASIDELLSTSVFDGTGVTDGATQALVEDLVEDAQEIEVPLNRRVLAAVELYTGRYKASFEAGLARAARYLPMIRDVFRSEGLPLDLAYIPLVESSFKPLALSRASAKGMWQFMRATALENGLVYDWYIDERADPEKATRAAARYLKTLHEMFGDWHLALAAYNSGPGRVQRALKSSGQSDFWGLSASTRHLPRETRDYVPLVLGAIVVARNPGSFGLEVEPHEAPAHETVTLAQAVDLRRVAEWTGAPVETIQDLNPELRRWTTPIGMQEYTLRVPEGSGTPLLERMASMGPDDLVPTSHYTVRRGDTLSGVAKRLKVSRADLADANYLSREARLQIGQALIVPRAPAVASLRVPSPPPASSAEAAGPVVQTVVATSTTAASPEPVVHDVRRGETLFSIARRYRTTVALLKQWNALGGNLIRIGQRLTIFRPGLAVAP